MARSMPPGHLSDGAHGKHPAMAIVPVVVMGGPSGRPLKPGAQPRHPPPTSASPPSHTTGTQLLVIGSSANPAGHDDRPSSHIVTDVAPGAIVAIPVGQAVQTDVAFSPVYDPTGHIWQLVLRTPLANHPGLQSSHSVDPTAAAAEPAGHGWHSVVPDIDVLVPRGHGWHPEEPEASE